MISRSQPAQSGASSRRARSSVSQPSEPTPGSEADLSASADPESVVRSIVLTALTAAPRSRSQLESKLAAKGAPPDVVRRVLDRFEQVGLVNDTEFARSLVRSRQASRGLATRALRQELRRSGIDDETAASVVDEVDPADELATARALVAKRLPATRGLPTTKRISRLVGMLARKGYGGAVAMQVVREALAEDEHFAVG